MKRALFLLPLIAYYPVWADPLIDKLSLDFKRAYDQYAPLDLSGQSLLMKTRFAVVFKDFSQQHSTKEGSCSVRGGRFPVISINQRLWDSLSEVRKQTLFYHELGHCLLGRKHRDADTEVDGQQIPASLMRYDGVTEEEFLAHRDYYLEELFFHKE